MPAGRIWPPEWRTYKDRRTGVEVRQLTGHKAHSYHLYFTNPGWYARGRKLLFGSDRENRCNLYGLDLQSGEICQLTDVEPVDGREPNLQVTCLNPLRDEAYFCHAGKLLALDLGSLELRAIYELPQRFRPSMLNCTADGRCVCLGLVEDMSDRIYLDLNRGYIGFNELFEAYPLSRIVTVPTDGAAARTVWEEICWIGHVNTSPTQANLLTFCHEGPWHKVDNRIWRLDLRTGTVRKLRPCAQGECVGHEFWYADGVHIGYHGFVANGTRKIVGRMRHDGAECVETDFPHETGHTHSNDGQLIVGDAQQVRLWKWNGRSYDGPRILCEHRCSAHIQHVHVHPRFTPDGRQVLFTSDMSGYGNVYLAAVPEFEALPEVKD